MAVLTKSAFYTKYVDTATGLFRAGQPAYSIGPDDYEQFVADLRDSVSWSPAGGEVWSLNNGGALTGNNTISGAFNIGFTNNAVGFGVAPGSITPDTRVEIRGAGITSATNALRIANSSNLEIFKVSNDGSITGNGWSYDIVSGYLQAPSFFTNSIISATTDPLLIGNGVGSNFTTNVSILSRTPGNGMSAFLGDSNNLRIFAVVTPNNSNRLSQIRIDPTINVAGGSPTLIGVDYQPTITALGTAIHLASRWASGSHVFGGTSLTHASLIVDIQSTTQAFAPPRMTSTQRDAIASPATGAMLFVNDSPLHEGIHFFDLHWRKCVTKNQILSVTSKNITQSVLDNTEIPNSVVVTVEAEVQFIQTSGTVGSSAIYYHIQRTFRKTSAGTLAAVAATTTVAFANDTGDTFTTLPQLVINANAVCVNYDISASTKTFNVKASVNYHFSN